MRYFYSLVGTMCVLICQPLWAAAIVELTPLQAHTAQLATTVISERTERPVMYLDGVIEADPRQVFQVSAPVDGRLIALHAVEQQSVRKGEVLARLQVPGLGQTYASYLDTLARYRLAQAERERLGILWRDGIVPENRWRRAEAEYQSLVALLESQRQQLLLAGLSPTEINALDEPSLTPRRALSTEFTLVSPSDGIVLHSAVQHGQTLQSGTEAFRIANLTRVWAAVRLPVGDLPRLEIGTTVRVETPARVGKPYLGRLESLSAEVDPQSQTVSGRVVIENPTGVLRPGMYVRATVNAAAQRGLMAPAAAVFQLGEQHYVFKQVGERRYEAVAVTLGVRTGTWVLVRGAVKAGDAVVSRGLAGLKAQWQLQDEGN